MDSGSSKLDAIDTGHLIQINKSKEEIIKDAKDFWIEYESLKPKPESLIANPLFEDKKEEVKPRSFINTLYDQYTMKNLNPLGVITNPNVLGLPQAPEPREQLRGEVINGNPQVNVNNFGTQTEIANLPRRIHNPFDQNVPGMDVDGQVPDNNPDLARDVMARNEAQARQAYTYNSRNIIQDIQRIHSTTYSQAHGIVTHYMRLKMMPDALKSAVQLEEQKELDDYIEDMKAQCDDIYSLMSELSNKTNTQINALSDKWEPINIITHPNIINSSSIETNPFDKTALSSNFDPKPRDQYINLPITPNPDADFNQLLNKFIQHANLKAINKGTPASVKHHFAALDTHEKINKLLEISNNTTVDKTAISEINNYMHKVLTEGSQITPDMKAVLKNPFSDYQDEFKTKLADLSNRYTNSSDAAISTVQQVPPIAGFNVNIKPNPTPENQEQQVQEKQQQQQVPQIEYIPSTGTDLVGPTQEISAAELQAQHERTIKYMEELNNLLKESPLTNVPQLSTADLKQLMTSQQKIEPSIIESSIPETVNALVEHNAELAQLRQQIPNFDTILNNISSPSNFLSAIQSTNLTPPQLMLLKDYFMKMYYETKNQTYMDLALIIPIPEPAQQESFLSKVSSFTLHRGTKLNFKSPIGTVDSAISKIPSLFTRTLNRPSKFKLPSAMQGYAKSLINTLGDAGVEMGEASKDALTGISKPLINTLGETGVEMGEASKDALTNFLPPVVNTLSEMGQELGTATSEWSDQSEPEKQAMRQSIIDALVETLNGVAYKILYDNDYGNLAYASQQVESKDLLGMPLHMLDNPDANVILQQSGTSVENIEKALIKDEGYFRKYAYYNSISEYVGNAKTALANLITYDDVKTLKPENFGEIFQIAGKNYTDKFGKYGNTTELVSNFTKFTNEKMCQVDLTNINQMAPIMNSVYNQTIGSFYGAARNSGNPILQSTLPNSTSEYFNDLHATNIFGLFQGVCEIQKQLPTEPPEKIENSIKQVNTRLFDFYNIINYPNTPEIATQEQTQTGVFFDRGANIGLINKTEQHIYDNTSNYTDIFSLNTNIQKIKNLDANPFNPFSPGQEYENIAHSTKPLSNKLYYSILNDAFDESSEKFKQSLTPEYAEQIQNHNNQLKHINRLLYLNGEYSPAVIDHFRDMLEESKDWKGVYHANLDKLKTLVDTKTSQDIDSHINHKHLIEDSQARRNMYASITGVELGNILNPYIKKGLKLLEMNKFTMALGAFNAARSYMNTRKGHGMTKPLMHPEYEHIKPEHEIRTMIHHYNKMARPVDNSISFKKEETNKCANCGGERDLHYVAKDPEDITCKNCLENYNVTSKGAGRDEAIPEDLSTTPKAIENITKKKKNDFIERTGKTKMPIGKLKNPSESLYNIRRYQKDYLGKEFPNYPTAELKDKLANMITVHKELPSVITGAGRANMASMITELRLREKAPSGHVFNVSEKDYKDRSKVLHHLNNNSHFLQYYNV